jgi:hypothetical protein
LEPLARQRLGKPRRGTATPCVGAGAVVGPGGRVRYLRRRAGPSVTTVENLADRRGVEGVVNATEVATTVATPWAARRERSLEDMGGRGGRASGEHAARRSAACEA